jgi:hypothetical protein
MKLADSAHTSQPWRIHEIARDFRVEDVWALPELSEPDDFRRLVELFVAFDPARSASVMVRWLFAVRRQLGAVFGWDNSRKVDAAGLPSLRDRLPRDLRDQPGPEVGSVPFRPLYLTDDEFAAEIANRTMHGVVHLGSVFPRDGGSPRGQLAILVKPNGRWGEAYMLAIRPFRYLVVYPPMLDELERRWHETAEPSARQDS